MKELKTTPAFITHQIAPGGKIDERALDIRLSGSEKYRGRMRINIVTVYQGWILSHIADRVINSGIEGVQWSKTEYTLGEGVAINFYLDIQNCFVHKTSAFDIGLFTHLDRDSMNSFRPEWHELDHIIHMGNRYYDKFAEVYPKEKMSIIYPFDVSGFQIKKPVIGVFQRGEYEGKGVGFMPQVLELEVARNFEFIFVGRGWEEARLAAQRASIGCQVYDDADYSIYQSVYHKVDYVLIPSLWEGGPMAIAEAMAQGIPIISADVGWAGKDFPVDHIFQPGDLRGLENILLSIYGEKTKRRAMVENHNYKMLGEEVLRVYGSRRS